MKAILRTLCVVAPIVLPLSRVNADGLLNGGFEAPRQFTSITEYTAPQGVNPAPDEFGWKIESGDVDLLTFDYWQPSRGGQSLELNGSSGGVIYQDFTVNTPGRWMVTFDMSANPDQSTRGDGFGQGVRGLRVDFGLPGAVTNLGTYQLSTESRSVANMEWVSFVTPPLFITNSVVYRLQFSSLTPGISGPVLDNVEFSYWPYSRLRVSEVEFCWDTEPDILYEVQYRSELTGSPWLDLLGTNVTGTGSAVCVSDRIAPGQPRRYYRAVKVEE